MFFLASVPGLISLSLGFLLNGIVQIHSDLGWSARLPAEIPSREKIRRVQWWYLLILIPLGILLTFIIRNGITWLHMYSPVGLWITFILAAGVLTFGLGFVVIGVWPSLLTQLYWEQREGKIIVKQGDYWIGEGDHPNEQLRFSKIDEGKLESSDGA